MINYGDFMRIGLFDSGVGGLTVLRSLVERYPNNEYIYYGDTLNNPYGSKSIDELLELASKNIEFLLDKGAEVIVVACGTVSSNCIFYLRDKYKIRIYDVISNTLEYLNNDDSRKILVIGTERTIDSHIFKNNVDKCVIEMATPLLVPAIENNEFMKIDNILDNYLLNYSDIDTIVLGCTHYPIISKNIDNYYNGMVKIVNMGEIIKIDNLVDSVSSIKLYFSKIDDNIINNCNFILKGKNIEIIK